ncbi:MAG: hypothetical protein EAZ27_14200 [Cytophagales bacterium]|nr:MAG: hypothetical protein EAZ27_14200 [Cytophagales bacterium]
MVKKTEKTSSKLLTTEMVDAIQVHLDEIKKLTEKCVEAYHSEVSDSKKDKQMTDTSLQKILEVMEKYPQFVPPYVEQSESKIDLENFVKLDIISAKLKNLSNHYRNVSKKAKTNTQTTAMAFKKTVKQAMKLEVVEAKEAFLEIESFSI